MEAAPSYKQKAFAYITRGVGGEREILLLAHPDHPEAGIQVPAGTMLAAEPVLEAVLREASEETGLKDLTVARVLGTVEFDARPFGRNEVHLRHFVHLRCGDEREDRWEHWEEFPDDEPGGRVRFELYWARLDEGMPELIAGHGAFLGALLAGEDEG
jgi:ADP-ribose pyrophosphatase YjhB (NUDIX family)